MPVITTHQQLKQYVKATFTANTDALPDIVAAENTFIVPIIGSALLAESIVAAQNTVKANLCNLIRAAVAPLSYWLDLATIHIQIGSAGLGVNRSDNQDPVHRWEYEQLKESLAEKGSAALEAMMQYLYANKAALGWTIPDGYKSIIKTGDEFKKYYFIHQPYRTFEMLRPLLNEVEDQYLVSSIGQETFDFLKDYSGENATVMAAVRLLKKAAVNYTINKAVDLLPIKITVNGFTVALKEQNDKTDQGQQIAPDSQFSRLSDSTLRSANSYIKELIDLLDEKATDQLFEEYKSSKYYTSPTTKASEGSRNESRTGIFGF